MTKQANKFNSFQSSKDLIRAKILRKVNIK